MGTCFEELPELAKLGVDEGVIRGLGGVVYLGECHPCDHGKYHPRSSHYVYSGGEETVSGSHDHKFSTHPMFHHEDIVRHSIVLPGGDTVSRDRSFGTTRVG